ncbi:uncharacterized protein Z519_12765 [Cladophialophora bantiana CBS 173.52]|uniref:Zn(2)-C6 fungal-type domain-containing protein n=1 Tax=Cladophialophora bantiana (strain ATCC 10958 / CBS 173.52 / CDC B-1940 / NIH 8579) TaxID=1442370 RepID=A0A0D2H6Y8_CLAB1|nr:uncharacterized protein Z519_12765 [Cladophialophora bantiana CBS 173.52]KIW86640.1 hypothetical protein Z519_12765 [Cladophialophora bantiana CBS 173.52]
MSQTSKTSRIPKRLREGSRTCSECRRRKVRCAYGPDSAGECARCLARGIRCIVPKPRGTDDASEERKTLRERVADLELLVESLSREKKDIARSAAPIVTARDDVTAENSDDDLAELTRHAPLVAALEASQDTGDFHPHAGRNVHFQKSGSTREDAICDQLRAALPSYDELRQCFSGDTRWWDFWHIKTFGADAAYENLPQFLERTYTTGTPIEVGYLVSSYGRHNAAEASQYLPIVDHVVLANDLFASTLDGLLLTVFHAKVYLDVGQPRRAFLCNRHGISLAQIMNLHRNYSNSPRRSAAWWTLYLGDRFLSVLLGLPYAISDDSFVVTYADDTSQVGHATYPFAIRLGLLTSRVIDQVQSRKGPKFSDILDIDDELASLANSMTRNWWDHNIPVDAYSTDMNELRERLICQAQYFLTRTYLHLPYLLKTPTSHLYVSSRLTAIDSAKDLLKRYLALRSHVNDNPIFDCQSLDFVGFMASVILVVGSLCDGGTPLSPDDIDLINKTVNVLQVLAGNRVNHLSRQCHKSLAALLVLAHLDNSLSSAAPSRITIPFFGTLYVTSERQSRSDSTRTSGQHSIPSDYTSRHPNTSIGNIHDSDRNRQSPTIAYEGIYRFDSDMDCAQDELGTVAESFGFMTDLDQDWESFFNSNIQ